MDLRHSGVTGAVISLYDIGCALGAILIGFLADAYGRERTLSIASFVFTIGALLQAVSQTVTQIVSAPELYLLHYHY